MDIAIFIIIGLVACVFLLLGRRPKNKLKSPPKGDAGFGKDRELQSND